VTTRTGRGSEVQDILRLSAKEAAEILDGIEAGTRGAVTHERRGAARVPYREVPRVVAMLESEEIGKRTYAVIPRNISRRGMAMLHGKFVYNGTGCVLGLKALDGQVVPVRGRVMWCRLVTGRVHEVGIRFDEPVDLADFVPDDQLP
jgi:hypothetical protein